jgi:Family of unknown function (DUF5758)/Pentapeptide repeats (8 copies)
VEIKSIFGNVLFALEGAKTILEVLKAAIAAKADLRSANLYGANLYDADLRSADLRSADLRGANLGDANLGDANLGDANLYGANLYDADLRSADLRSADLRSADLRGANLGDANLRGANLGGANLYGANLYGADLRCADLGGANLYGADLRCADLGGAKNAELAIAEIQFIPEEGAFVGWKKCRGGRIVKLLIGDNAKRSHGSERKCRCSSAKVLAIFLPDGVECDEAKSMRDRDFIYRVGMTVEPEEPFEGDRWNTCSSGIHFFITRREAEAYTG